MVFSLHCSSPAAVTQPRPQKETGSLTQEVGAGAGAGAGYVAEQLVSYSVRHSVLPSPLQFFSIGLQHGVM